VRLTSRTRILAVPAAVALGASLFTVSLTWQVPSAQASSAAVTQRNEIYRLINGSRAANGKAALNVDIFLESKATDGAIPCPDDAAKSIGGRAADMFTSGMSHYLRLCDAATPTLSTKTFVSVLQGVWGYGSVGEILGTNSGYGTGAYTFTYKAFQTSTYSTTGHMMAGWASSSSHWGIIMGQYNRVGCGVWAGGSAYMYACEFAGGSGPAPLGLRGAPRPAVPTRAPVVRTPAPTPTPGPTQRQYFGLGGPDPFSDEPYALSTPTTATPNQTAIPLTIADATATSDPVGAGLAKNSNDMTRPADSSSAGVAAARTVAFLAGSAAGLLSALLALLSMRRRRRETAL
jgi:hypothetical protein